MNWRRNRILLVDDDDGLLRLLSLRLKSAGYEVQTASSGEEALVHIGLSRPQVVITDLCMQGMDGMALFKHVQDQDQSLPVIVLTAHGTIPDAVQATQNGIFGYLTKPYDASQLMALLERAMATQPASPDSTKDENCWHDDIISASPAMESLLGELQLVAQTCASVLILGESGTGKELIARAIHRASPRRRAPFLAINCAAIPEPLLESELFGHTKGAFTGATATRTGLLQAASGGSVFLDEIGDMPMSLQAKLLRVIEDREVRPLGSSHSTAVDIRFISATHRDLEQAIGKETFRADLYYRLNVVNCVLPPLRERREDIPLLARHFLNRLSMQKEHAIHDFTPEAMEILTACEWPGNVRQLMNVVEQCHALNRTTLIPASMVSRALQEAPKDALSYVDAKEHFEREYLIRLLKITCGRVSEAARLAGRNRTEFYRFLQRHHLTPSMFRSAGGGSADAARGPARRASR